MKQLTAHERLILTGDHIKCPCDSCVQLVAATRKAVELIDGLDASWLVKDFSALYLAALDVSESIVDEKKVTPPVRHLRAQLARLREAFVHTEEVQRYLRERNLAS